MKNSKSPQSASAEGSPTGKTSTAPTDEGHNGQGQNGPSPEEMAAFEEALSSSPSTIGLMSHSALRAAHKNPGERRVQTSALPSWTADDIRSVLRTYDRSPFQDLLSSWLSAGPTLEAIRSFADKYPDRWAGAIAQLAKVAGFSERREVLTAHFNVTELSDSQLEDQLIAMAQHMGVEVPSLLEAVQAVMIEGSVASPETLTPISEGEAIPIHVPEGPVQDVEDPDAVP